jgi:hypothetical protein
MKSGPRGTCRASFELRIVRSGGTWPIQHKRENKKKLLKWQKINFRFGLRIFTCFRHILCTFVYDRVFLFNTIFFVTKLETTKNHRKPWKFKMKNLKKEDFGIRSAPLLTADRSWLADLLFCAIGIQQQADNFVRTSIFLSAFIYYGWSK